MKKTKKSNPKNTKASKEFDLVLRFTFEEDGIKCDRSELANLIKGRTYEEAWTVSLIFSEIAKRIEVLVFNACQKGG